MAQINKELSICFIGAGLEGGGIERAFTSLANYYCRLGMTVSVIVLFKRPHFFSLDPRIQLIEPIEDRSSINKYIYAFKMIFYLRKSVKAVNPDTLVSFGEWLNPFVILATRFLGIPLFVSDRMSPLIKLGILQDVAKRTVYRMANGIISQTNYARKIITERTNVKNIIVIPNPVNIFEYPAVEKKNVIVTLGRLSREKGHRFLIEAFAKTHAMDWKLAIIGDGDQRASLENLASELGVADRIVFYGHLKNFGSILAESRIFVLPSLMEGFPNALIEAMSVPLACISSDCIAGPGDIIQNGNNGILVQPGDSDELARQIDNLIENEGLRARLAENAIEIRNSLNFETIANRYLDFITAR